MKRVKKKRIRNYFKWSESGYAKLQSRWFKSLFIPPVKLLIFLCFQGVEKVTSGVKCVKMMLSTRSLIFQQHRSNLK